MEIKFANTYWYTGSELSSYSLGFTKSVGENGGTIGLSLSSLNWGEFIETTVDLPEGTQVVMDAPPKKENIMSFIKVAKLFADLGLHVPEIHRQNLTQGFLLLEDLGTKSYLDMLTTHTADALYGDAFNSLFILQSNGQ